MNENRKGKIKMKFIIQIENTNILNESIFRNLVDIKN